MATLSEWLQIMLAEIARKREDRERAREEEVRRDTEKTVDSTPRQPQRASQR
jgi:septal ring factor EnvC (AmiA/AmiB activator)